MVGTPTPAQDPMTPPLTMMTCVPSAENLLFYLPWLVVLVVGRRARPLFGAQTAPPWASPLSGSSPGLSALY